MPFENCIQLHFKVLTEPRISLANMVRSMKSTFRPHGYDVQVKSLEALDLPALTDLDIGPCSLNTPPTAEQRELFRHRRTNEAGEIVIYFVHSTIPPTSGCAVHPNGRLGAVVTRGASRWTLAHEVGHLMGLRHTASNRRLMTGGGTINIVDPPPDLIASELTRIRQSGLAVPCDSA